MKVLNNILSGDQVSSSRQRGGSCFGRGNDVIRSYQWEWLGYEEVVWLLSLVGGEAFDATSTQGSIHNIYQFSDIVGEDDFFVPSSHRLSSVAQNLTSLIRQVHKSLASTRSLFELSVCTPRFRSVLLTARVGLVIYPVWILQPRGYPHTLRGFICDSCRVIRRRAPSTYDLTIRPLGCFRS